MPTLSWIGKEKVVNHHLEVAVRALRRTYSFDGSGPHSADGGSENSGGQTTVIIQRRTNA